MKAYELFSRDLAGNELTRVATDRRAYYHALRQALKDEVSAGAECELLKHYGEMIGAEYSVESEQGYAEYVYGQGMEQSAPVYLYLLDAAALWECYEAVIDGIRYPRDIGQGFPFLVGGRRLMWSEVQRMAEAGTLPVAVADDELRARLSMLLADMESFGAKYAKLSGPAVNNRATLQTAEVRIAAQPAASAPAAVRQEDGEIARLRAQVKQLETENAAQRAEIDRLSSKGRADYDAAAYTAELILHNRMEEAAAQGRQLGGRLQAEVERLMQLQAEVNELKEQAAQTEAQLQAERAQAEGFRAQLQAARQAAQDARGECEELQKAAAEGLQEKQETEERLTRARAELSRQNAELRELQRQLAQTAAAAELTRRQAERLS